MIIEEFIENPHPFLAGMSEEHLRLLGQNVVESHFAPGDVIFREGERANRFYLVQRGEVALQTHPGGKAATIQVIRGGDVLGWSWLFPPHHWHFDARAQKDTETLVLDAVSLSVPGLREKSEIDITLGYELMTRVAKVVVNRLQATRLKFVQSHKEQLRMAAEMAA